MNATRSELRKLWTVPTTWVVTLLGLGLVTLSSGIMLFSSLIGEPFAGTDQQIGDAIDQIGGSSVIVLIVAVLAMTTEFRHGTIGRTLQIAPSRTRTLLAKLTGGTAYALAFFAASLLAVGVLLAVAAGLQGVSLDLGSVTAAALWQGPVGLALTAVLGVAIGALVRSQVIAVSFALLWVFMIETLVAAFAPNVGRWLPFQALNSLFIADGQMPSAAGSGVTMLAPAVGLSVFLGYVLVASTIAIVLMRTRDI